MAHTDGRPEEPFIRRAERALRRRRRPPEEPDAVIPPPGDLDAIEDDLEPPTLDAMRIQSVRRYQITRPAAVTALLVLALTAILLGIWTLTSEGRLERVGPVQSPQQLPGVEDGLEPGRGDEF